MRIDQIKLCHLRMPLKSPFETSFGRILHRDCILIIINSNGVSGYGECVADRDPGYSYETSGTAMHILKDFFLPLLVGKEIQDGVDLQRRLAFARGHPMAKSGLEMAIWDLTGKLQGKSFKDLLGGVSDQVSVGVSIGIQRTTQDLVESVSGFISQGYGRIKIKIKPDRDIVDTFEVRKAFPDLLLQVDANSAYTLESAKVLKPLDNLNLLMIEQPLDEDDLWDHSKLQPQFRTPLCLDESILSLRHARQAIEMGACRIINIKMGRVGGLSEAIKIHNYCHKWAVPVWCGGMLETGVGRAANLALASLPGFSLPGDISATDRYYEQDIITHRYTLNPNSTIDLPTGPGLGVELDLKALKSFSISEIEIRA